VGKMVAIAFIALNVLSVAAMAAPGPASGGPNRGGAPLPVVGVGLPGLAAAAGVYFMRRGRKEDGK